MIEGFARFRYASEGPLPPSGVGGSTLVPLSAFAAIDGRAAYRLNKGWTFAISGQNIAHARQQQTAGPDVERQIMGFVSYSF